MKSVFIIGSLFISLPVVSLAGGDAIYGETSTLTSTSTIPSESTSTSLPFYPLFYEQPKLSALQSLLVEQSTILSIPPGYRSSTTTTSSYLTASYLDPHCGKGRTHTTTIAMTPDSHSQPGASAISTSGSPAPSPTNGNIGYMPPMMIPSDDTRLQRLYTNGTFSTGSVTQTLPVPTLPVPPPAPPARTGERDPLYTGATGRLGVSVLGMTCVYLRWLWDECKNMDVEKE